MTTQQRRLFTMLAAIFMGVLLAVYIGGAIYRAIAMFQAGTPVAAVMALALLVLSLIALWALYREIRFGFAATRLTKQLAIEGQLLKAEIATSESGRADRVQAQAVLPELEKAAAENATDWRYWQRLGIVRRAAGDNGGARKAIRTAINLAADKTS